MVTEVTATVPIRGIRDTGPPELDILVVARGGIEPPTFRFSG